jgi:hypothetical protein
MRDLVCECVSVCSQIEQDAISFQLSRIGIFHALMEGAETLKVSSAIMICDR